MADTAWADFEAVDSPSKSAPVNWDEFEPQNAAEKARLGAEMRSLRRQRIAGDFAEGLATGAEAGTKVVAAMSPLAAVANAGSALGLQSPIPAEHVRQAREALANLAPRAEMPDAPVVGGTGDPEQDRAIAQGVESSIDEQISGLARPDQLGLLVAGAKAPIPVARAFQFGSIAALPEAIQSVQNESAKGDVGGTAKAIAGMVSTAAIPAAIEHGIPRTEIPALPARATIPAVTPEVTPTRVPIPVPKKATAIPEIPATAAEPQRNVPYVREIREAGAKTKEDIRKLFPGISREDAARVRDEAWPEEAAAREQQKPAQTQPASAGLQPPGEPAIVAPKAEPVSALKAGEVPTAQALQNASLDEFMAYHDSMKAPGQQRAALNEFGKSLTDEGIAEAERFAQESRDKAKAIINGEGDLETRFKQSMQENQRTQFLDEAARTAKARKAVSEGSTPADAIKKFGVPASAVEDLVTNPVEPVAPATPATPEVKLGVWPESEWSAASLAKQTPIERASKAKFLGLRDKDGQPIAGPKTLADAAKKRIEEIKAEGARPKAEPTPEPTPAPVAQSKRVDLGNGIFANINTWKEGADVRYEDAKGNFGGSLEARRYEGGHIVVEVHSLEPSARGFGAGGKAIQELGQHFGEIVSDEHPSADARAMWERIGAKRERVTMGEHTSDRYVYRPSETPQQTLPQVGQPLIDVPRGTKPLVARRAQLVRMLEDLTDLDPVTGKMVEKEGLTDNEARNIPVLQKALKDVETQLQTTQPKETNARPDTSSKTLYGDVRTLEKPAEVVPTKEGERRIQPQTTGGLRESAQPARAEENKVALTEPAPATKAPESPSKAPEASTSAPKAPSNEPADIKAARNRLSDLIAERDRVVEQWHAKAREEAGSATEVKARNEAAEKLKEKARLLGQEMEKLQNVLFDAGWKAETAKFRGKPPEKPSPPAITNKVLKAQRENLLEQVDEAIKQAPEESAEKITIAVPGDGEFTINNTKDALKRFRDHAAKEFPSTIGKESGPSIPSGKARSIPKVDEPKPADLPKIVGQFVSDDPTRYTITGSYADGTQIVATNGRQLIRVWTDKAPGTPVKPVRFDADGKPVDIEGKFPNFLQIRDPKAELLKGGVPTDDVYKIAAQAKMFSKEDKQGIRPVKLFVNKDGTIGGRQRLTEGDVYEHNVQPDALPLGTFNPQYIIDAMDAARRLGNEKVDIYGHSGTDGPLGFVGKNHESIVMPMKMEGETADRAIPSAFSEVAGKKSHPMPIEGLGPIADPDAYASHGTEANYVVVTEGGKIRLKKKEKTSRGEYTEGADVGTPMSIEDFGKTTNQQNASIKTMLGKTGNEHSQGVIADIRVAANNLLEMRNQAIKDIEKRQNSLGKAKGASVNVSPGEGPKAGITPDPGLTGAIGDLIQAAGEIGGQIGGGGAHAALMPATQFGNGTLGIGNIWRNAPAKLKSLWGGFAMHELPDITRSDRPTGEAGVRYAASPLVARTKGTMFAGKVLEGLKPEMDLKLGVALSEDNLRSIRKGYEDEAKQALAEGGILKAQKAKENADNVTTLVGQKNSPFKSEKEYQAFLKSPEAKTAITRHNALWEAEKDPLYRQANDLDPDLELETRGEQTGARVNLKHVMPGEATKTTVGRLAKSTLIKQTATLLRRDPFATRAKGSGSSYEGSYTELLAHGFEREYPVAMQHEFIRQMIEAGDAALTTKEYPKGLELKGEATKGFLMKLRPFEGRFLQVRKSLAPEYQAVTGLNPALRFPVYSKLSDFLTAQSIKGVAEGSTHVANILTQAFTGLGPTSNPLLNTLIKITGRPDVLWTIPKILIKGFTDQRQRMLDLGTIGATKEQFGGGFGLGRLINRVDQGVRIVSDDVIKGMQREGWVENTETERRHFVNQVGQYNKRLQPVVIRSLRELGVQPFATAVHTFNLQGVRELTLNPGVKAPTKIAALALRAEKAAGWAGLITTVATINYLLSGKAMGPKGTKLLSIGWVDPEDHKLHQFDVGRLTGYGRALDRTGIGPMIEAHRQGLSPNTQVRKGLEAIGNTAVSYIAGPLNRTADVAVTGSRPGVPQVQEAPIVPPRDDFAPLKSQIAANIKTALQQANPIIDAAVSGAQGKETKDIATKQLSRYMPKTGLNERTIAALPKIVKAGEMNDYVDALSKQLRKLPREQRWIEAQKTLANAEMAPADRSRALQLLKRKRLFSFE